jgi:anthranilate phosphoribosyltransferase
VTVAKHGNRSVSSTSGSADVLQALGVNVDAPPALVEQCLAEAGIGFLFAPRMHGAMKHAIGPRREMGIRTVFNILGPLTNPAGATRQLVGVYDAALAPVLAEVLGALGSERALVVHGHDGLDEISITGETTVAELDAGRVTTRTVTPEALGLERAPLAAIQVQSAEESAARIRGVLDGAHGPARAITLLNAGAAVYVAGRAGDMKEGVRVAREAVDSGAARTALDRLAALSARGA